MEEMYIEKEATRQETDEKCPACGAPMVFDVASGKMKCPYCDTEVEIPEGAAAQEEEQDVKENDLTTAELTGNHDWGSKRKQVTCKSCGATTIYDELEVSAACPYCGSTQVMEESAADSLAPGGVCPFEVTAQQAGSSFAKWIKGKWFCPREAKRSARPEAFRGVYLPFWTFDARVTAPYSAEYGRDRRVRDKEGNTRTVTDWYPTKGVYTTTFDDELVCGSTRYGQNDMRGIEPFHTERSKPYRPEYVAGFGAERYSIGLGDAWKSARSAMERTLPGGISAKVRRETAAQHVRNIRYRASFTGVTYKYLLLPVWLSAFRFKNKVYQFKVNGQTGKVSGKTPVSPLRVAIAVGIGLLAVVVLVLLWLNS